ncbi:MAG TPA: peptide ABC transporter substrate-binding protein [Gemmatimonas sp.]|nr:peptide ABC transporter substrate-binding protein [Gemmatimonas sp.]
MALFTAVTALLFACGAPPRAPGTAVIASGADLESGNPAVTVHPLSRQVQRHALFVTLVRLDSVLQPEPYLSRTWSWSPDRRTLTFVLYHGLRWHDGMPTSAADVQFTLDAVRDPDLGSPRAGELAGVDSVRATGTDTLRVFFRQAPPALPTIFAELPVVPRHLLDSVPLARWRGHAFSTAPVGNGPFRFVDRIPGRRWRFARNDSFPKALGGPPRLQQLVVAVVDEAATKYAGLVSGELDLAGVSPAMAHLVKGDPSLALLTPPALFSTVLAFNSTKPPFDDPRVRHALSLSIDRARIVDAAVAGYATPAAGAVPPGLPFSSARTPVTDIASADRLLDAAGWKRRADGVRARGGARLDIELLSVGSGDLAVEHLVQADLAQRGITVTIRVAELASFLGELRAARKTFDVAFTGIPGDLAMGHLSALFMTSQRGGALDYTGFHSPNLDAALQYARAADVGAAGAAWQRVDSLLAEQMPVAWIYHSRGVQGMSRLMSGVHMDLRGELVSVSRWSRAERK